ncbi:MAG TPA: PQQ-binding-like beta-propeller repeat protein [Thermoplasmata archaeon]|nr:PQQ-binding-like beta-propeller repeat protein [Thermoplasmata archaeon]
MRIRVRAPPTGRIATSAGLLSPAVLAGALVTLLLSSGLSTAAWTVAPGRSAGTSRYYPNVPPGGDLSTYLSGVTRHANNPNETVLNVTDAHSIKQLWSFYANKSVFSQPAVVNGVVYLPTWSGYLDAINLTDRALVYRTFEGTQVGCSGRGTAGSDSSPTLRAGSLYFGAAGPLWLAVGARNGTTLWNVSGGPVSKGFFNWGSPLLVGTEEYVGLASFCDRPLVPAALLAINTTTHHVDAVFNTTLNSTLGASIWSSPSYDPELNEVFATTGNGGRNRTSHLYAESILAFTPGTLTLVGHWRVPSGQVVIDGDFGATPTIYDQGGTPFIAALNKDGFVYAWNRTNVTAGPVWSTSVGASDHDIASMSYDGSHLYVGVGAPVSLNGKSFNGSLWALNPDTGSPVWETGLPAPVFTAPFSANGLVVVASGGAVFVLAANNGTVLTKLSPGVGYFVNAPEITHGIILAGSSDGRLYAYGLPPALVPGSVPGGVPRTGAPATVVPLLVARWS